MDKRSRKRVMFNYKYHIFCCNNERSPDNPKGSCKAKGAAEILDFLKKTVHEKKLKKKVRVTGTKCLGACSHGPSIVIYPEGSWYTISSVDDAKKLIDDHIVNGKPVENLLMRKKNSSS